MTNPEDSEDEIHIGSLPPVAIGSKEIDAGGYKNVPVDPESALYDEKLVDLKDYGVAGVSYYHIDNGQNPPYGQQLQGSLPNILARRSVANRLRAVNKRLRSLGLELFVWDAYRPLETQMGIWRFFEHKVRLDNRKLDDRAVYQEVIKYVSDPNNFRENDPGTWPTHMTGASVDLTIREIESGALLDMGAHFDQMDDAANSDYFERLLSKERILPDDRRLINRRLLNYVMTEAGFTNYPMEYWHYDWGNQMQRFVQGTVNGDRIQPALYGIASSEA